MQNKDLHFRPTKDRLMNEWNMGDFIRKITTVIKF